ncbi:hypothetical protein KFE25_008703 [Diacronema lutheri]|uniref:FH2 domain-containing protein n=1 Tax=Diacronema lutheri TaxID=2081491 RepID=A0A8J5XXD6_DIALT|nr:hypothetical protein KFE25_008703 [Diacronema lutheri]
MEYEGVLREQLRIAHGRWVPDVLRSPIESPRSPDAFRTVPTPATVQELATVAVFSALRHSTPAAEREGARRSPALEPAGERAARSPSGAGAPAVSADPEPDLGALFAAVEAAERLSPFAPLEEREAAVRHRELLVAESTRVLKARVSHYQAHLDRKRMALIDLQRLLVQRYAATGASAALSGLRAGPSSAPSNGSPETSAGSELSTAASKPASRPESPPATRRATPTAAGAQPVDWQSEWASTAAAVAVRVLLERQASAAAQSALPVPGAAEAPFYGSPPTRAVPPARAPPAGAMSPARAYAHGAVSAASSPCVTSNCIASPRVRTSLDSPRSPRSPAVRSAYSPRPAHGAVMTVRELRCLLAADPLALSLPPSPTPLSARGARQSVQRGDGARAADADGVGCRRAVDGDGGGSARLHDGWSAAGGSAPHVAHVAIDWERALSPAWQPPPQQPRPFARPPPPSHRRPATQLGVRARADVAAAAARANGASQPGGKGKALKGEAATNQLKALHWTTLRLPPGGAVGTLWGEAQAVGAPIERAKLTQLFARAPPTPASRAAGSPVPRHAVKLHVISVKRAHAVEVLLSRLKLSARELAAAVLTMDARSEVLSEEVVEQLLPLLPNEHETAALLSLRQHASEAAQCAAVPHAAPAAAPSPTPASPSAPPLPARASLSRPEGALAELAAVPRVAHRLRAWLALRAFSARSDAVRAEMGATRDAMLAVLRSAALRRFIALVLQYGNTLNAGTTRGGAQAVTLAALAQLGAFKSADGSVSLLRFVADEHADVAQQLVDELAPLAHRAADGSGERRDVTLAVAEARAQLVVVVEEIAQHDCEHVRLMPHGATRARRVPAISAGEHGFADDALALTPAVATIGPRVLAADARAPMADRARGASRASGGDEGNGDDDGGDGGGGGGPSDARMSGGLLQVADGFLGAMTPLLRAAQATLAALDAELRDHEEIARTLGAYGHGWGLDGDAQQPQPFGSACACDVLRALADVRRQIVDALGASRDARRRRERASRASVMPVVRTSRAEGADGAPTAERAATGAHASLGTPQRRRLAEIAAERECGAPPVSIHGVDAQSLLLAMRAMRRSSPVPGAPPATADAPVVLERASETLVARACAPAVAASPPPTPRPAPPTSVPGAVPGASPTADASPSASPRPSPASSSAVPGGGSSPGERCCAALGGHPTMDTRAPQEV